MGRILCLHSSLIDLYFPIIENGVERGECRYLTERFKVLLPLWNWIRAPRILGIQLSLLLQKHRVPSSFRKITIFGAHHAFTCLIAFIHQFWSIMSFWDSHTWSAAQLPVELNRFTSCEANLSRWWSMFIPANALSSYVEIRQTYTKFPDRLRRIVCPN